jgi:DNA-binding winged helix-turn-helix (wHTH) protein
MSSVTYDIAGWRFDPAEPILHGCEDERHLEDRAARVLALLCQRRGQVVSKEEMIAQVWGGRIVSANSVSIVIGSLRRALDDNPADPAIIVTVARRGYRLVEQDDPLIAPAPTHPVDSKRYVSKIMVWWGGTVVLAAAIVLGLFVTREPVTLLVEPTQNATNQPTFENLTVSLAPVVLHGAGRLSRIRLLDGDGGSQPRIILRSRLILWNGAPEVALSAINAKTHTVIWSTFAAGPPAALARHVEAQIATLSRDLPEW